MSKPTTRSSATKPTSENLEMSSEDCKDLVNEDPNTLGKLDKNAATSNDEILQMLIKMNNTLENLVKGQSTLEEKFSQIEEKLCSQDSVIKDLENSANFMSNELEDLKTKAGKLEADSSTQNDVLKSLQEEIDNLQRYTRGFNLRFIGVKESDGDHKEDCVKVVSDLIRSELKMDVEIENAHRTGSKMPNKPRHIIARFQKRPERFAVLRNRKVFQSNKKILVVEDLIPKDLHSRRALSSHAQKAHKEGKRVRFSKGTLFINNVKFVSPND